MTRELTDDEKRVDELLTRAKKFGKMTLGDVEKLIERQEAEIGRLTAEIAETRATCSELRKFDQAEIERLKAENAALRAKFRLPKSGTNDDE